MTETLITFETAKLAKQKGFKLGSGWQLRSLYNLVDGKTFCLLSEETPIYACERCTQALLQQWLRKKHNIHIDIGWSPVHNGDEVPFKEIKWWYHSTILGVFDFVDDDAPFCKTYELALEAGLQQAFNKITLTKTGD